MPMVHAVVLAWRARDRSTIALFALVLVYALIALGSIVVERLQRDVIAVTHFRPRSLASWVVIQPLPRMYGHENRVFVTEAGETVSARQFERESYWVNHHPGRVARFDGDRAAICLGAFPPGAVLIRSRYRQVSESTSIVVSLERGRVRLRPRQLAPADLAP